MKRVGIIMDDELHKQLKHMAVNEGRTVTDIIVELVKAEVETKKRAVTVSLATDVIAQKSKPVNPGITLYVRDSARNCKEEIAMQNLMIFEGHNVEVFELNGQVLFNPYHVGTCLELGDSAVRMAIAKMNEKQVVKIKNSDVSKVDIRKLNNAGENFLTESGVYKLVFKSHKPNAEAFTDWIADEVLPTLRKTGSYEMSKQDKSKKEKLPSVNMMVKNVKSCVT